MNKKIEIQSVKLEVPRVFTLSGATSEFCKGYCLTSAQSVEIELTVTKGKDRTVTAQYLNKKENKSFSINKIKFKNNDGWLSYIKGVYQVMLSFHDKVGECDFIIESKTINLDLSSSRLAIITGSVFALNKLFNLKLDNKEMTRLVFLASSAFGQEACPLREIVTLLYARENNILKFDSNSASVKYIPLGPEAFDNYDFLLINPGVTPSSIIQNELLTKKAELKNSFEEFENLVSKDIKLRDCPIFDLKHRIIKMEEVAIRDCIFGLLDSKLSYQAAQELRKKDYLAFAKTLNKLYHSSKEDLGFFSTEIEWLVHHIKEIEGVHGSSIAISSTNAFVFIIAEKNTKDEVNKKLEQYQQLFGNIARMRYLEPRAALF